MLFYWEKYSFHLVADLYSNMKAIVFYEETSTFKQYIQSMEMVAKLPSNNSFQKYDIRGADILVIYLRAVLQMSK